jgi:hypothetical protein
MFYINILSIGEDYEELMSRQRGGEARAPNMALNKRKERVSTNRRVAFPLYATRRESKER